MCILNNVILISSACFAIYAQHNPNFKYPRRAIVELFEWKFVDIARECETFLGPNNFGGVQVCPVNENIIIQNRTWLERYQPMSFKILTRSGNAQEFFEMTRRCNNTGVRIYVDVVLNHMAAPQNEMIGTAGSTASYKNYPSVGYTAEDFHRSCQIESYFDAHEVRNCELGNMPDLNHASPYVRGKIVGFMNYLIDLGVLETEYTSFGVVTEFIYARDVTNIFKGVSNLSDLIKLGPELGYLHSDDALIFVDNPDTQRGFSIKDQISLNYKSPKQYIMANAFMLAYPYGTIRIMSSYNFTYDNIEGGPPMDGNENILSVTCGNGWICEHRWSPLVQMVKFRVEVFGTTMSKPKVFVPNTVGFCREDKGFIIFSSSNFYCLDEELVFVCVPTGKYCDVIAGYDQNGNCINVIEVDSK